MFSGEQTIAAGSVVIVHEDHKHLSALRVQAGQTLNNRFGAFAHNTMVGKRYGEQMVSKNGRGYVYLLAPSPELWTSSLSHRTQILYLADIAMICLQLEVLPGSVVIEAGTGSGSLSHALARGVGDTGHLHSYEFNATRAEQAATEFESNGLSPGRATCRHGDVCLPGMHSFGLRFVIYSQENTTPTAPQGDTARAPTERPRNRVIVTPVFSLHRSCVSVCVCV